MNAEERATAGTVRGCFGCGEDNLSGLGLAFARQGDRVVATTRLDGRFAGYRRMAHGGVVAALLDEAMGWALLHVLGRVGVTRDLSVSYRRPVAIGREISVIGTPVSRSGDEVTLESWVEDSRGRRLASARAEWVVVRDGHADEDGGASGA